MLSEEERKERRRAYNNTPRAKELKKAQKKRYLEKNRDKVNAYKRKYRVSASPTVLDTIKEAERAYNRTPQGKEFSRKQKERARAKLSLWYVRQKMIQGTHLKASDVPNELVEAKRLLILIKRERVKNEKCN